MNIRRGTARKVHFILDECVPPIVRDARWFMWIPFKVLFGKKAEYFFSFKERAMDASSEEIREVYIATADVHLQRDTDLNEQCIAAIKANIVGTTVLEWFGHRHWPYAAACAAWLAAIVLVPLAVALARNDEASDAG